MAGAHPSWPSDAPWCGFFTPQHPDLVAGELWPRSSWVERFAESEDAWIAQTYHRLRTAGYPVVACDETCVTRAPVVVTHPPHTPQLFGVPGINRSVIAVTKADKTFGERGADVVITQNGCQPRPWRRFVPHWPQVDLRPRDHHRSGLRRVCYKGRPDTLHPELRAESWRSSVASQDMEWVGPDASATSWCDYSEVDAVVALRPPDRDLRKEKPATKLVNAWIAGVPAILGDEPQYRELRCCELDYIEVDDPDQALAALRRLAADQDLYQRMVDHGRGRARAFDVAGVTTAWVHAITELRSRRGAGSPWSEPRRAMVLAQRRRLARSTSSRGTDG